MVGGGGHCRKAPGAARQCHYFCSDCASRESVPTGLLDCCLCPDCHPFCYVNCVCDDTNGIALEWVIHADNLGGGGGLCGS